MEDDHCRDDRRGGSGTPSSPGEHKAPSPDSAHDAFLDTNYPESRHSRSWNHDPSHLYSSDEGPHFKGGAKRSHDNVVVEDFFHDMKRRKFSPTYDAPMIERLSALSNFAQIFQTQVQHAALLSSNPGSNHVPNQVPSGGFDLPQPPVFNPGVVPTNLEELAMVNAFLVRLSEQISASANAANTNNATGNVDGTQSSPNGFNNTMAGMPSFGSYGLGFPISALGGFGLGMAGLGLGAFPGFAALNNGMNGMNGMNGFNGLGALGALGMVSPAAYQSALAAAAAAAATMSQHGQHANGGAGSTPYMDLSSIAALTGLPAFGQHGQQGPLNPLNTHFGFSDIPNVESNNRPPSSGTDTSASSSAKRAPRPIVHDRKRSRRSSPSPQRVHMSSTAQIGPSNTGAHVNVSPRATSATAFSGSVSSSSSSPSAVSASISAPVSPSPQPFSTQQSRNYHIPGAGPFDLGLPFDSSTGQFGHAPNVGVPILPEYSLDEILGQNNDVRLRAANDTFNQHVPKMGMEIVAPKPVLRQVPKLQSLNPALRTPGSTALSSSSSSSSADGGCAMNLDDAQGNAKIGRVRPVEPRIMASGPASVLAQRTSCGLELPSSYPDHSLKLPEIRRRAPSISSHSTSSSKGTETHPFESGDDLRSDTTSRPCTPHQDVLLTPTETGKITLPSVRTLLFDPLPSRPHTVDRLASDINRINIASRPSTASSAACGSSSSSGMPTSQEEKHKHLQLIRRLFIWINEDFARRHRELVPVNHLKSIQKAYEQQQQQRSRGSEIRSSSPSSSTPNGARSRSGGLRPGRAYVGYNSDEDIAMHGSDDEDEESVRSEVNEDADELEEEGRMGRMRMRRVIWRFRVLGGGMLIVRDFPFLYFVL
ncbi:uncharacterized protein EI90DRAFT_2524646 [Cantharellus anzutake]|uniref:uncharacterized protein n=1 Tax=Cantharellus anzutake TaxID=1750568 RepID=UPI0019049A50|nr:uncharacterized protein EI90DRAFT_2524646 [Cantharellus anzutake]KAF8337951.1 hypothetical protein EI90DRAFT_2524646 [Cantharellus anzutake]